MYAQYFLCGPHDVHAWLIAVYIASNIQKKKNIHTSERTKKKIVAFLLVCFEIQGNCEIVSHKLRHEHSHTRIYWKTFTKTAAHFRVYFLTIRTVQSFSAMMKKIKNKKSSANKMFPFSFFFFFKFINTIPLFAFTMPQIISINAAEKNTIQRQHTIYNFDK